MFGNIENAIYKYTGYIKEGKLHSSYGYRRFYDKWFSAVFPLENVDLDYGDVKEKMKEDLDFDVWWYCRQHGYIDAKLVGNVLYFTPQSGPTKLFSMPKFFLRHGCEESAFHFSEVVDTEGFVISNDTEFASYDELITCVKDKHVKEFYETLGYVVKALKVNDRYVSRVIVDPIRKRILGNFYGSGYRVVLKQLLLDSGYKEYNKPFEIDKLLFARALTKVEAIFIDFCVVIDGVEYNGMIKGDGS